MSTLVRSLGGPLVILAAAGYFGLLAIVLIHWHLSPLAVLALTVGGFTLLAVSLRPYLGLHAFIMILFVESAVPVGAGVTAMKVLGAVIFAGWLGSMALRRKSPFRFDAFIVSALLFLAWCAISLIYAIDLRTAAGRLITFIQLVMAALMFLSVVDSTARARGIYAAVVVWTWLATIVALAQYYLGSSSVAEGLVGNRNLLATYISVATVCAYLLYLTTASKPLKILAASTLPLFFLGLALTFSRTGLIVQSLALLAVWYRVARQRGFVILAGSLAALCLITFVLPTVFYQRARSIVPVIQRQEDTLGTRVRLWKAGLRMIESRPITGVGPANFMVAHKRYGRGEMVSGKRGSAHNTYISVAAEIGLVGLGLFILLMILALRQARWAAQTARQAGLQELDACAVITEIGIFIFLVSGLTATVENLKYLWILIGIAFGVGRIAAASSEELAAPAAALPAALSPRSAVAWNLAKHS
jgi:O-antigen ligase